MKVWRVICSDCGVKTEQNGISTGKKRYSDAVANNVISYTELMDNASAGMLLGLSQSSIYRIDKDKLGELLDVYKKHIPGAKRISVDEFAKRKGHDYATTVVDYDAGTVMWLEEGRKTENLEKAYEIISDSITKVTQVSIDLWPAYENATRKKLPQAKIVYDRFHIVRLLNRAVDEERREYQQNLSDEERKTMKKNARWVLLKRDASLTENNRNYLTALAEKNHTLYLMYLLKESFLAIFDAEKKREQAALEIRDWINTVKTTDYAKFKRFARSISARLENILNWFDCPISNGKMEGINNKIKTVMRRAYGYKDFDYMRMKILQKCGTLMNMRFHTF